MREYGSPAKYEGKVQRTLIRSQPGTTGSVASRTPLESLEGTITPSGLHQSNFIVVYPSRRK